MLRKRLTDALKAGMKSRDERTVSTVRLILAALKDRDIAARGKGKDEGLGDDEILQLLGTMIRQRHESIEQYEKGGRRDLAEREAEEIEVIKRFLPRQLEDDEIISAIKEVIAQIGATSLKDMGPTMAALRSKYAGQMDFAKASGVVKRLLA